jgi:predicted HNH restriction endonuclease
MSIPNDDVIQKELLYLLAHSPDGRFHVHKIYAELAKLHPELTHQELNKPYRNSKNLWANRVQFARLHLTQRRLLYKDGYGPNPSRGVWIITDSGRKRVEDENTNTIDSAEKARIEAIAEEDIAAFQNENEYFEGRHAERLSSFYERNSKLRAAAIMIHGRVCLGCGFNFELCYGEHGSGYIEVHHLKPISTFTEETQVDPNNDMTVLCSNCHRMIHRKKNKPLSLDELRAIINTS